MAYLYRHIRLDKNEPFYIGIGKSDSDFKRAYSNKCRNVYWNNIVSQTEYRVEIMISDITWEEACQKEIEFISLYKKNTQNGTLCNIADGGGGGYLGDEVNQKRRQSLIGHSVSEITKNKIREKAIGRKASSETKNKMSATHKERKTGSWIPTKGHSNGRAFKVYQYDLDGNFIKEWDCARYAIVHYNWPRAAITECIKGRLPSYGGFLWKKEKSSNQN
jgi:hypothetical protein